MSNETTQDFPNGPSFEERVFARFDSLDSSIGRIEERQTRMEERQSGMEERQSRMEERQSRMETRLDGIDERLQVLENKSYDTKPIWEHALTEILALREDVHTLDRKFNVLTRDVVTLRADQARLEDRMDKVDSKPV